MRSGSLAAVLALVGNLLSTLAAPAAAQVPTCFGALPTPGVIVIGTLMTGTPGDDVIIGTPLADIIDGRGGNDKICSLSGNDTISGDAGNDVLRGEEGSDRLFGGSGVDYLAGGDLVDICDGGTGNDGAAASCETRVAVP